VILISLIHIANRPTLEGKVAVFTIRDTRADPYVSSILFQQIEGSNFTPTDRTGYWWVIS